MEVKCFFLFCTVLQFESSCLPPCGSKSHCSVSSHLLTPDNINDFAMFINSTTNRVIHIGTGPAKEVVIKVLLGEVDLWTTIVVTVGLNKAPSNTPGTDIIIDGLDIYPEYSLGCVSDHYIYDTSQFM